MAEVLGPSLLLDKALPTGIDYTRLTEFHYGDAISGSTTYWERARAKKIAADIKTIVVRGIWTFEQKLLGRFFASTETVVGSAGYNVPFVHSTGGVIDFAPFAYEGQSFTTS